MTAILALVLKGLANPRLLMGVAFAAALAFSALQGARIARAKADLATARAALIDPATRATWRVEAIADGQNLAIARRNATTLSAALDAQNQAVTALRTEARAANARAQAAVQAAQANVAAADANAARILVTPPGPDACQSADAVILGSLK